MTTFEILKNSFYEQIAPEDKADFVRIMGEIAEYGADTGISGFIYPNEIKQWWRANRPNIFRYWRDQGFPLTETFSNFNWEKHFGKQDLYLVPRVIEALIADIPSENEDMEDMMSTCRDVIVWATLELFAQEFVNSSEFEDDEDEEG